MDSTEPRVVGVSGVFTRASSGLVRQVSTSDTIYYGAMAITIAYMVFIVTAWPSYPGSSMELATLLVVIGGCLLGVVYALFASVYPPLAIFTYTTLVAILSGFLGFAIAFLVVAIAGVFFPFTHRDTLERSPANIRVAGIPLMAICGVLAIPFIAFIAYRTATDKALGANAHVSLIVNGILIAVGFGWFYALRWYRRSRGEDVDRRFKEIPIE